MARRQRLRKVVLALLLAISFWYAVPYVFPLRLDPNPLAAAADEAAAYQGSLSRQIAMPLILLLSSYGLLRLPRVGVLTRWGPLALLCAGYVSWAFISLLWCDDLAVGGKRLLVFGVNLVFVITLASLASVFEMALFGFFFTGAVALIALCADVFALHDFAPFDPDYRFMGVMTANFQAINLFVGLICGATLALHQRRWFARLFPWLLLYAVLLFLTRARIGTMLFLGAALFIAVRMTRQWLRPQGQALILLLALSVGLPLVAYLVVDSGGAAFGSMFMMGRRDTENTASLSNRAPLWGELSDSIAEHPVRGYGFESFWTAERVQKISADQGWVVPHAHNTYLDQVLSLGLVGGLLYAGMLLGGCITAWRRYCRRPDAERLMPALLLSWLALLGLTESLPLAPQLPTLLAYACLVKMCMSETARSATASDAQSAPRTLFAAARSPSRSRFARFRMPTLDVRP